MEYISPNLLNNRASLSLNFQEILRRCVHDIHDEDYMTVEEQEFRSEDRAKFARLATKRVNSAAKAIQLVGNLSNRSNYYYTEKDVAKIFKHLQTELDRAKARFAASDGKGEFSL
jgi:hypothetical protein